MKKAILLILILSIAAMSAGALAGCSPSSPVPGLAWAKNEVLTYDIKDGETSVGTLTVTAQKLEPGDYTIARFGDKTFTVSNNVAGGTRITKTALDTEGKEIMYSESILNGFSSLASYKKMDYAGKQYETKVYHEGKYFYYNTDGGSDYDRIKAKTGYADNELLYYIVRCYDIEAGYSSTYSVLNPLEGNLEKISVSTTASVVTSVDIPYTDRSGNPAVATKQCLTGVFAKTDSPSGSNITVLYSPSDFELLGNVSAALNKSIFLPVRITENNLTYYLTGATAL